MKTTFKYRQYYKKKGRKRTTQTYYDWKAKYYTANFKSMKGETKLLEDKNFLIELIKKIQKEIIENIY